LGRIERDVQHREHDGRPQCGDQHHFAFQVRLRVNGFLAA
jgi:hypothetical protein